MTPEEYRMWARDYANTIGLDPDLAEATWKQESGGGLDTALKGPNLSRGRGNAIGPWQVVPYYHPNFPVEGDAKEQGKYAMDYLKKVGPAQYYGLGKHQPGQPTTEQYVRNVTGGPDTRMASNRLGSTDTDRTPSGNPMTGEMTSPLSNPALLASLGILPQVQQPYQDRGPINQFPARPNPLNELVAGIAGALAGGGGAMDRLAAGGGAITDLQKNQMVTQKALNEQWMLEEEMGIKREELDTRRRQQATSGVPANIQEMLILKQMYPHMNDADLMSMAFAGRVPQGGTKVEKVGDRLFNVAYDQMGRPQYSPLSQQEQKDYEDTIGSQKKVEKVGETFGKAQVDTLINTSGEYQKASSALNSTENILKRFEAGEFDGATGPIAGRLGQFFSPETAQIQAQEMTSALANLGIQNLAPVSNYEIDLIKKMDISSFSNKAQNIAVLKDLAKVRKAKADTLKRTLARLKTESIEDYLGNPETIDFNPGGGGGGGGWTIEKE